MAPMNQRVNSTQTSIKCGQCKMDPRLSVNADSFGFTLRVINSQRQQLNGLEINCVMLVARVFSRLKTISLFLKLKLR